MYVETNLVLSATLYKFLTNYVMIKDLQSDVAFKGRLAPQVFICAAARASPDWDASRYVDVFYVSRVLLFDIHQLFHGLTHALRPHLLQCHHYMTRRCLSL